MLLSQPSEMVGSNYKKSSDVSISKTTACHDTMMKDAYTITKKKMSRMVKYIDSLVGRTI